MPNVAESPKTGRAGPPKVVELDSVAFYLNVAYDERAKAKALDAQWDGSRRAWYAPRGSEAALASYKVEQVVTFANGAGSPEQEFARALRDAGLDVDAPEMDGKIHRVPVIGGKSHSKDGAYCGSVDGVPHGFVQNPRRG